VLAPVVGGEGGEVGPLGLGVGVAGLAADGVAHPVDALAKYEDCPEDGISVWRQDTHYERCNHECEECDVEEIKWARVNDGAKGFDLLIAPAGGDDAVLETGVCVQREDNAEDIRRKHCRDPKVRGVAVWMVNAGGAR